MQKITGSKTVDRPLQRIREFRNRPAPAVAVTVDMLSTGVDIPDLAFIIFLRPVKSRILFEQMLGRGTRKGDKFPDKSHFTVFDCFDGTLIQYFRQATGLTAEPLQQETRTIQELVENIWQNRDRDYNARCLVKRMQRIDKEMSGEARDLFAAYVVGGDLGGYARDLPAELKRDFTGAMKLLRDEKFLQSNVWCLLPHSYSRRFRVASVGVGFPNHPELGFCVMCETGFGHSKRAGTHLRSLASRREAAKRVTCPHPYLRERGPQPANSRP